MVFVLLFKITIVIYLVCLSINSCRKIFLQGYHWRDFAGEIPSDAFAGGRDRNGNPIYIGQILHDNNLLITKTYENDRKGYYGFDSKEHSGTNNHKILCTQYPENLVWVYTTNNEIHLLINHDIIVGGYEPGFTLYIGRIFYNSETTIGKVSTGRSDNYGLFITDNGEEINMKSFEILTYTSHSNFVSDVGSNFWYTLCAVYD